MKQTQRTFIPGSQWVYFKLYMGTNTADKVLSQEISHIIKVLKKDQLIDKWFFIRYSDPDFHIRIRILVKDELYIGRIINIFYNELDQLVKKSLIWKIQLDTYNRELERYGNELIGIAESFFFHDSECVLSIIKRIKNDTQRWMIALKMIDSLLTDFSFDLLSKQKVMGQVSDSFKTEFGFNQFNSKQLNAKYRDNKKIIESILNNTIENNDFKSLYLPIKKRSKSLMLLTEELKSELKTNVNINLNNLILSYIHMMLNRLFQSKNRVHELLIYDFMKRYYTSEMAKNKYIKS